MAEASDEPSQDDPLIGQTLGEFEIVELIGQGGMGAVYKASQPSLGRFVAVKVLPAKLSSNERFLARFEREARAAAAVEHPNIVEIFSVGEDRGYHYIAMELVHGHSLSEIVRRRGPLPADQAVEIIRQTATALAKAHAAGILHRDIKPSNILLAEDGQVKVADFGLAKRPGLDADVTHVGKAVGTPNYLAPECIRGGHFDARSDLYALGATFYHILSGQPPFAGHTAVEIVAKVLEAEPPRLREIASGTPRGIARLIHRLLSKDPDERCRTAEDFLEALAAAETAPSGSLGDLIDALRQAPSSAAAASESPSTAPVVPPTGRSVDTIPLARKAEFPIVPVALIGSAAAAAAIVILAVLLWPSEKKPPAEEAGGPTVARRQPAPPEPQPQPAPPDRPKPKPKPKPPDKPRPKPPDKPKPKPAPAWQADWNRTQQKVRAFVGEQRFGQAMKAYESLGRKFEEAALIGRIQKAAADLEKQADAACRKAEQRARQLLADGKFDQARAALAPVKNRFGMPALEPRADKLLAEIAAAEKKAPTPPAMKPTTKPAPAPSKNEQARFARAMKPIDAKMEAWDFSGAAAALAKLKFEDKLLSDRLAVRRDEAERLAKLKAKLIARANRFKPWVRKGTAVVPGSGGKRFRTVGSQIAKAADAGLTLRIVTKTSETTKPRKWADLDGRAVKRLLAPAVDKDSADDQLAAGILLCLRGELQAGEGYFERAKALGARIDRHLDPLAAAAFADAGKLLEGRKVVEADAAKLYSEAARLYRAAKAAEASKEPEEKRKRQDLLLALKAIVARLKKEFARTPAVTDEARRPNFAELVEAVRAVGEVITVRKDGQGDHRSVQAAINAAPPNSLIEIQDEGPYVELLVIPKEKADLRLRGKKGIWPLITSAGLKCETENLVDVQAYGVWIARLILAHEVSRDARSLPMEKGRTLTSRKAMDLQHCAVLGGGAFIVDRGANLRDFILLGPPGRPAVVFRTRGYAPGMRRGGLIENGLCGGVYATGATVRIRCCTCLAKLHWATSPDCALMLSDCIARQVETTVWENVQWTNAYGRPPYVGGLPGRNSHCSAADPRFRDPANLDYRLKKSSPCRGKASDGGDLGCRWTPEMVELLKKVQELRKKGIVKF